MGAATPGIGALLYCEVRYKANVAGERGPGTVTGGYPHMPFARGVYRLRTFERVRCGVGGRGRMDAGVSWT